MGGQTTDTYPIMGVKDLERSVLWLGWLVDRGRRPSRFVAVGPFACVCVPSPAVALVCPVVLAKRAKVVETCQTSLDGIQSKSVVI